MKFDTLFLSRTCNNDYHWICKPDYVDKTINDKLRPLFLMIESKYNEDFFLSEGRSTYYFFFEENYCALCYLYFTDRTDFVGRQIYALEGICCKREESHLMWNSLFDIICRICETDKNKPQRLRRYIAQGWNSEYFPDSIDFPEDRKNWLTIFKDAMFANLKDEMNSMDRMYSFVFGWREADFYPLKLEKCYRFGEERKNFKRASQTVIAPVPSAYCDVSVFFSKYRKEYQMSMVALNEQEDMIFSYENIDCFKNGELSLAKLYQCQRSIKEKIAKYGYRMKSYPEYRRNIRKTKNLSIGKKGVDTWKDGLNVYRLQGLLTDWDGYVEELKEESHALIRQFFQYARRISVPYFEKHAWETIYILNLQDGIWVFSLGKQDELKNGQKYRYYIFDGICIPSETKQTKQIGWAYLASIIEKYILNKKEYSQAFVSAYEKFKQDMAECTQPFSCIVTSLPDGNFPEIVGLKVYTVNGKSNLFQAEIKVWDGSEKLPELSNEKKNKLKDYRLVAPTGIRRTWNLGGTGRMRGRRRPLDSIEENSCEMIQLWEEICTVVYGLSECLDTE